MTVNIKGKLGRMTGRLYEKGDGSVSLQLSSTIAGEFQADVVCFNSGELVSSSGIKVPTAVMSSELSSSGCKFNGFNRRYVCRC
jgi:hypothetical protein